MVPASLSLYRGLRWSTLFVTLWRGKTGVVLAFILISVSVVGLSLLIAFSRMSKSCRTEEKENCSQLSKEVVGMICVFVFATIFLISGSAIVVYNKRFGRRNARETAVSDVPTEDSNTSYINIHIPQRPPFGEATSTDLPDYFTAVQNIQVVPLQLNVGFWMEDIDDESPPPSYEQILRISEAAVSDVATEDLKKSPALILPYNHIPQRPPFGEATSMDGSINLPDYFTAVRKIQGNSPQLNMGFWTEDIDNSDDENPPPPCHEQALSKISGLFARADTENQQRQENSERGTRL